MFSQIDVLSASEFCNNHSRKCSIVFPLEVLELLRHCQTFQVGHYAGLLSGLSCQLFVVLLLTPRLLASLARGPQWFLILFLTPSVSASLTSDDPSVPQLAHLLLLLELQHFQFLALLLSSGLSSSALSNNSMPASRRISSRVMVSDSFSSAFGDATSF